MQVRTSAIDLDKTTQLETITTQTSQVHRGCTVESTTASVNTMWAVHIKSHPMHMVCYDEVTTPSAHSL